MDEAASASTAARVDQDQDQAQAPDQTNPDATSSSPSRRRSSPRRRRRKRKGKKRSDPGLVKKLAFVTHLLNSLDVLVFAELSSLYYMECVPLLSSIAPLTNRCSMFRFLLRAAGQWMYLTPKDEAFPFAMPARRTHVLLILLPNIFCILLHLLGALPEGPEFHRGYQHGGVVIDFIGQTPASSRAYYILVDLAILVVQSLMLTVHTERENLRIALKTFRSPLPEQPEQAAQAPTLEDLDAEERGVSREPWNVNVDGIEMQDLGGEEGPAADLTDIMNSGNAILGDYHILNGLRTAAANTQPTVAHSLNTFGYSATLAMLRSQRQAAALG